MTELKQVSSSPQRESKHFHHNTTKHLLDSVPCCYHHCHPPKCDSACQVIQRRWVPLAKTRLRAGLPHWAWRSKGPTWRVYWPCCTRIHSSPGCSSLWELLREFVWVLSWIEVLFQEDVSVFFFFFLVDLTLLGIALVVRMTSIARVPLLTVFSGFAKQRYAYCSV